MDNKLHNMLNQYIKTADVKNEEELQEKLNEFIKLYNNKEIDYEDTPLDEANKLLDKAKSAKTKKTQIKYANAAFAKSDACFDAIRFLADIEEDYEKAIVILKDGLEYERNRLAKKGYFTKDNEGEFYQIFETRPYIRGLNKLATYYTDIGKMRLAIKVIKEILRLNENDNTGARHMLAAIYAFLEEERDLLKLCKKYTEDSLPFNFSLFALYYKLGNDEKAKEYALKTHEANPYVYHFFKGDLEKHLDVEDTLPGYFSPGKPTEIAVFISENIFLFAQSRRMGDYYMDIIKPKKTRAPK